MRNGTASQAPAVVERRIVSVLFADLVGFTSLSERLDAEDVAAVQEAYFAAVHETLTRHGGVVEKFIGDAVMAVFGVPRTRDDDAERAVRAGLALVAAVEALGGRIGLDDDELRLRVGITTGEVAHTAGADGGRVTGDTVNTAARLQAAADTGSVLVDEATALAVAETIETRTIGPIELKGKTGPVPAAIALTVRPDRSREAAMGGLRAPTIGRTAEIDILLGALERVAAGVRERWLVVAPPGVGKSRLLAALVDAVDTATMAPRPALWRTRLRPDASGPFDAVAALLIDAARRGSVDRATIVASVHERLIASGRSAVRVEVLTGRVDELVAPPRLSSSDRILGSEDRDLLFADWLEILDVVAAGSLQVWLVEDVHWSRPDVRAFLDRAHTTPGLRMIVATTRPALLDVDPGWTRSEPTDGRHRLELRTLTAPASAALVHALVGDALPPSLVERVVERSDGTPLFIEELLRTWASAGILGRAGDRWVLHVDEREVPLPTTVQAVYAAQLDDLPTDTRTRARRASVAGRRFPVMGLKALDLDDPGPALDALERRAIVAPAVPDPIQGDTHAYRHALLRDAGYASLARADRARYHIRLGRWLEGAAGERVAAVADAIAGHYVAALDSAPALAAEVGDGLDRAACTELAASWLERAAVTAMGRGAYEGARQLGERSVELTGGADRLELARRRRLTASAIEAAGDMDAARTTLELALRDAQAAIGDAAADGNGTVDAETGRVAASVAEQLAAILLGQLRFADAIQLVDTELGLLGRAHDEATARLLSIGSLARTFLTNAADALADAELAAAIATEVGDPTLVATAAERLVYVRDELGLADADDWIRIAGLAADAGDWPRSIDARLNAARHSLLVDPDAGLALVDEADVLAEAYGLAEQRGWADQARCATYFAVGRWDDGIATGRKALERAIAGGFHRVAVRTWFPLVFMASARRDRRLLGEAAAWFDEHAEDFPDSPYARLMHGATRIRIARAGLGPMPDVGIDHLGPALDLPPVGLQQTQALATIVERWQELGRTSDVAAALDRVAAHYVREPILPQGSAAAVDLMRSDLVERVEDHAAATTLACTALAGFRDHAVPYGVLLAIHRLEVLGVATDTEIGEAVAIADQLGIPRT